MVSEMYGVSMGWGCLYGGVLVLDGVFVWWGV